METHVSYDSDGAASDVDVNVNDYSARTGKRLMTEPGTSVSTSNEGAKVDLTSDISSKGKQHKKKFQDSWLNHPEFKDWLRKVPNNAYEARCNLCSIVLKGYGKSELLKHANTQKHKENHEERQKSLQEHRAINQMFGADLEIKRAEVILCSFIAENNLPLDLVDRMLPMIRALPRQSQVLEKVRLGKQKATNIIRQGLGPYYLEKLLGEVNQTTFTVCLDETTDVSGIKQAAVVVAYTRPETLGVETALLDIRPCSDATAQGLFETLESVLEECHINKDNWAGFCADTTNSMFGSRNSVTTRIREKYPWVVLVKCSCHMLHLVSSKACEKLSTSLEDTCRSINDHFNRSFKNTEKYREFQDFANVSPHKILKPGQTRWLSLQDCVRRILCQWPALLLYWTNEVILEDRTRANQLVLDTLKNPLMRCLMEFLEYALGLFNESNALFQGKLPLFHRLRTEIDILLRTLAQNFMERDYIIAPNSKETNSTPRSAFEIDPMESRYYLPLEDVYIGHNAYTTLQECEGVDRSEAMKIYKTAREFYIEAILQIKQRFALDAGVLEDVELLAPDNARNLRPRSIVPVARKIMRPSWNLNLGKLDGEWREQAVLNVQHADHIDYWKEVLARKTSDGKARFGELEKIVRYFLCLPVSNAAVERLFSNVKNVKTDKRNSLANVTLKSLIYVKEGLERDNKSAANSTVDKNVLSYLKNVMASSSAAASVSAPSRKDPEESLL